MIRPTALHVGRLVAARLRDQRGFSLVEVLIAVVLLSILVTMFAALMQTTVARSSTLTEQATLETQGRATVDTLAADLRQATCFGTTPPIVAASGTTLTFYAPDRLSPYHMQEIFYSLAGGTLTRTVARSANTGGPPWGTMTMGPVGTRATSVTNALAFDYFDNASPTPNDLSASGASVSAANLPKIATTTVTLTLAPKSGRGAGLVTVEAKVSLRTPACSG